MSIKNKLILILLACSILPMLFVGTLSFLNARNALENLRMEELTSITGLKVKTIADFFAERKKDILAVRGYPDIKRHTTLLADCPGNISDPIYRAIKDELDSVLKGFQLVYNYMNVILANTEGKIVYVLDDSGASEYLCHHPPDLLRKAFEQGKDKVYFSDIFKSPTIAGQSAMLVSAPVHSLDGKFGGVIAYEINMAPIYELIQDTTGLGRTGETLIAKKVGGKALFLNPLRHDPKAALKREVIFGERQTICIQEALKGNDGSGLSVDYRGQEVIAAWRHIPTLDWGMVTKIDISEAFEPTAALRDFFLILVIAVLVLGVFASLVVAKSISDPIQILQKGAEEIGKGNLDHKVATSAKDEIGRLGRAFDQMTEKLKAVTASRDDLNREINERKKVETALQFTRFSIDHANDMLYWIDSNGNIVDVNDTFCHRLGYSRAEIVSMRVDDVDPYMPMEEYDQIWHDLKRRGTAKEETVHYTKDGQPIPVEITLNYIKYGDKEFNCAFARDISERKQAAEELQKSMDELAERIKELNCLFEISRLVEKRRLSLEELLQGIVELIPPAWQYPDITCAKIVLNGQEFQTSNFKDPIWKQVTDIIVKNVPSGNLVVGYLEEKPESDEGPFLVEERALLGAIAERLGKIIERRQSQTALEESEKRFRDLVENSLTGISIVQDNQVVYQNQEQERLLGPLPRSYLLADFEKIHPDDVAKVKRLSQRIDKGEIQTLETDFRFYPAGKMESRGDMRWVYCRALLTEYKGKEAILVNMIDMTRAKELEHLLTIQDKMASLGRVAAGIAHEIRNPLSGINIYLNTLKKLYHMNGSEEKVKQILGQIQSASHKIESVIRRVMDFAKPGEPKLALIDINRPITEAVNLTAVTMRKSGIALEKALSESLPLCNADPTLIEEMILNMLNNAAEAMKTMEEGKKIVVTSSMKNDRIIVTISDSGPGIPGEIKHKIFDPYFTTKSEGTGIGLSLSHRIVTDHAGSLTVSDSDLGGAEFRIEIPIKKPILDIRE